MARAQTDAGIVRTIIALKYEGSLKAELIDAVKRSLVRGARRCGGVVLTKWIDDRIAEEVAELNGAKNQATMVVVGHEPGVRLYQDGRLVYDPAAKNEKKTKMVQAGSIRRPINPITGESDAPEIEEIDDTGEEEVAASEGTVDCPVDLTRSEAA